MAQNPAEPAVAAPASGAKWNLSFDCATRTFAFSLCRVDLAAAAAATPAALAAVARAHSAVAAARVAGAAAGGESPDAALATVARASESLDAALASLAGVAAELRSFLRLVDGETVDLLRRPDREVTTVERLRAVARYTAARVAPAVRRHVGQEPLRVIVEFQMGPNARSRAVAAALIALFADNDVVIVGPALKNKVAACDAGKYCHFAARCTTSYAANKAHAKYNFRCFEEYFGSTIPATSLTLRGHIADSFMQVLGYLAYGKGAQKF